LLGAIEQATKWGEKGRKKHKKKKVGAIKEGTDAGRGRSTNGKEEAKKKHQESGQHHGTGKTPGRQILGQP